jgi:hypothetical protein
MIKNYISETFTNCLLLFAIYYLFLAPPAYGYFDLGTGTYMLQMLLGFGAAVWLSMRTSFIRFDRKRKGGSVPATGPASGAATADTSPVSPSAEGTTDDAETKLDA